MATCVTGGAAGDDANRRLAAFDRILAARERWGVMAALDASFAMEVGVITDPWKNAPAATRGTPGAGEAPVEQKTTPQQQRERLGLPGPAGLTEWWTDADFQEGSVFLEAVRAAKAAPATPATQQRPAREAKLLEMGQACLDWAMSTVRSRRDDGRSVKGGGAMKPPRELAHALASWRCSGPCGTYHTQACDEGTAAIKARDAEHAAAFEALEEHVACVYASEAGLRMELAEAVGVAALAAAPEAVSACRQHIDCVAADMAHMNAFGELASHGSLLDQARRAIDAAAPAVVPAGGRALMDIGETSDGYHTFNELYDHRITLWIALCRFVGGAWRSRLHSDGTSFEGCFVLGLGRSQGEQITYHLPLSRWGEADFAETLGRGPEFDGHTSAVALVRIKNLRPADPTGTPTGGPGR